VAEKWQRRACAGIIKEEPQSTDRVIPSPSDESEVAQRHDLPSAKARYQYWYGPSKYRFASFCG
jgi:hypothetical protein